MVEDAKYITVTDDTFEAEVLQSDQPVLVDFWAAWCGPCKIIEPLIVELAEDFEGRAKLAKLDVDNNPTVAMNFGVRSIPTLLFFKDGRVVDQLIGAAPKKTLSEKLENLVAEKV